MLVELNSTRRRTAAATFVSTHVTADSSSVIEWYSETTSTSNVDFLLMGYWEAAPGDVLMVVADKLSPSTQALDRLTLLEGWGYTASLIDDGDPQSEYDTALPDYNLVYVPSEANAAVGSKISGASLGIVSEHASLVDDFGFSSASASSSGTILNIADATHYITSPFSAGPLTIVSSSQPVISLSGYQNSHLATLGQWGTANSLVTLEAGALKLGGARTNGRRVQLPWGTSSFDINAAQ